MSKNTTETVNIYTAAITRTVPLEKGQKTSLIKAFLRSTLFYLEHQRANPDVFIGYVRV